MNLSDQIRLSLKQKPRQMRFGASRGSVDQQGLKARPADNAITAATIDELEQLFPLLQKLRFQVDNSSGFFELPPISGILAAMTNPDIDGDTCALLPVRDEMATYVAVLVALSGIKKRAPDLLRQYVEKGFKVGERVRVLPTEHVYVFDGTWDPKYGEQFRLKVLDDKTNGIRSLPMGEAIRLEKTSRSRPKGTLKSDLGGLEKCALDKLLQINTGGNAALLRNEIMLVTTQKSFADFLGKVVVYHVDSPNQKFRLADVMTWGIVTPDGDIDFKEQGIATGTPLIAVSPRVEYVASACKKNGDLSPRVIIDGANRARDLQSFDDIVDFSKLLVVVEHSNAAKLREFADRGCDIWKMPDGMNRIAGQSFGPLAGFRRAYRRAGDFELIVKSCESKELEAIYEEVRKAQYVAESDETDDLILKIVGGIYSVLLGVGGLVHTVVLSNKEPLRKKVENMRTTLRSHRVFLASQAYEGLDNSLISLETMIARDCTATCAGKQDMLIDLIDQLLRDGKKFVIVGPNRQAISSAKGLLAELDMPYVPVRSIRELQDGDYYDAVILTGWPRANYFNDLVSCYSTACLYALSYQFEEQWFSGVARRRDWEIRRWTTTSDKFCAMTGLSSGLETETKVNPPSEQIPVVILEKRLQKVRKALPRPNLAEHETRDAFYVGFVGSTYAFLTESNKAPVISGILGGGQGPQVLLKRVRELNRGDIVLFRGTSDSDNDILRVIAQAMFGETQYEELRQSANRWRFALLSLQNPIGRLRAVGVSKTNMAIRGWLYDEDRIGPGDKSDLEAIAKLSGDNEIIKSVDDIWAAISKVRGLHISAGTKLRELLLKHLPAQLPELNDEETAVDLSLGNLNLGRVVLVEVEDISKKSESRAYWEVNRLMDGIE